MVEPVKSPHVTDDEAEAIVAFASDVAGALGLPTWQIAVMEEPVRKKHKADATITPIDGRYFAEIRLAKDWMTFDEARRRQVIVHEILHLLHVRINDVFEDARDYMHDHEHASLHRRFVRETELMVDHLSLFLTATHTIEEAWDTAHGKRTDDDDGQEAG